MKLQGEKVHLKKVPSTEAAAFPCSLPQGAPVVAHGGSTTEREPDKGVENTADRLFHRSPIDAKMRNEKRLQK